MPASLLMLNNQLGSTEYQYALDIEQHCSMFIRVAICFPVGVAPGRT